MSAISIQAGIRNLLHILKKKKKGGGGGGGGLPPDKMFTDARTFTSIVHLRHSYIYVSVQAHTDNTKSVTHHSHLQILAYVHTEAWTCTH